MSTELQQYSIANQSAAIALYAAAHNIGIIHLFVDEGKSGTTIKKRKGLQELLRVVQSGEADFDEILVYDVSRWGRFPDSDELAHYEYLCKQAGIKVHYCAEQFDNDNRDMLVPLSFVRNHTRTRSQTRDQVTASCKRHSAKHQCIVRASWEFSSSDTPRRDTSLKRELRLFEVCAGKNSTCHSRKGQTYLGSGQLAPCHGHTWESALSGGMLAPSERWVASPGLGCHRD